MKTLPLILSVLLVSLAACQGAATSTVVATSTEAQPAPKTTLPPATTTAPPPTNTPFAKTVSAFAHGISLGSQGDGPVFRERLAGELEFLASLSVDTVRINTQWFMPGAGASEIRMLPEQGSMSDDTIRFFAESVYNQGMDSWLALHLYYDGWTGWAGGHRPDDWAAWEESYTLYVLHHARLSETLGIDYLSIMNELHTPVVREEFMLRLIRKVREVYSGKIVVNIDSCPGNYHTLVPPAVVAQADVIGLQLYPAPQTPRGATVEQMARPLEAYFNKVADHFARLEYQSLIISEFGITRLDGATSQQCTWMWPDTKQQDLREMADYYEAFAAALDRSRLGPMLDGVVLHEWKLSERIFAGDYISEGVWGEFVPQGNPLALQVIARWYPSLPRQP